MLKSDNISEKLAHLSAARRALIEKRLSGQHTDTIDSQAIRKRTKQGPVPLSFAQQRLWFIDQLEPQSAAYNIPAAVRLSGALNLRALRQTINEIIRRHETLRTSFVSIDGQPQQVIAAYTPRSLPLIDLSALAAATRESETQRLAAREARQAFDLAAESLLRVQVVRLSAAEHVVLFTMHHIVSDGWSLGVLIGELTALYGAYASGEASPLRELELQYADYAVWQREWLQGEVLAQQLGYWKEQLAELPAELELGVGRGRPAVQSYRGATVSFAVSAEVSAGLKRLSQREGATLFMTLLAAFKVLLQRYSGQAEIVVGTDIANRNRTETEKLIGFFVNQLVLRTDIHGDPRFTEVLGRVRSTALAAYEHQDVPFEKLVEELQPVRDLTRHPLFQMKFILQNAPTSVLELRGLTLSSVAYGNEAAKLDITLALTEGAAGLSGTWTYNTDLFDEQTIERMKGHYQRLLSAIVADPEQQISALPLLSESEQYQLLEEWNETRVSYPREHCVHELFEAQVERTPDAIAVVSEQEEISYAELNRRANQLAHYLRRLGVRAETLVGLALKRSVELVVGVLGVLKAGGGYVPLDVSYPLERLQFMLEDAGVSVLVTEERLAEQLPAYWGQTVCVDRERESIEEQSGENVRSEVSAANVAYVIYTSGSSGKPKGVIVEHGSLGNYLHWVNESLLREKETIPLVTSLSFDASLKQLLAPLLRGAGVWIVSSETVLEPRVLVEALSQRSRVTLNCVPSLWASLLARMDEEQRAVARKSLARLLLGGEAVSEELRDKTLRAMPAVEIWNLYGPTEATGNASAGRMAGREVVSIGRPIANTEIYILDAGLNPTPVGVAGELYIGGDGLARGYLRQPELTAEKFIPHPFARTEGARLYRTGDRARYQADGKIEYLGRLDEQVKVRGYRIELGEIEAALVGHPEIKGAVVMASADGAGEKRLVAYVVTGTEQRELREWLKQKLPDYMVPQMFVTLEALPLTANGKVDRRALPAATEQGWELSEGYVAPRTVLEELIANIWAGVLGVVRVGIHDNFFELGGHSLLAMQVISRVREAVQVELAVSSLFEEPTVAGQARRCEEGRRRPPQLAPPLQRQRRDSALPLSFAQLRLWFIDQLEPNHAFYNSPQAVRLSGELNKDALQQTLTEIVRRHEVLRTTFKLTDGEPLQVIAGATPLPMPEVDLSELAGADKEAEVRRLAQQEAAQPFDLSTGPLLRVKLLRESASEHVVLLTMHHIVSDGWSMGVLINEVAALYRAYYEGAESPLPELEVQYADFAVWQRGWLQGEALATQMHYWETQLRDLSTLELPTDRARPALPTYRGGAYTFEWGRELTQRLHEVSKREGVTLFMTLLAGFQALLARYSGQTDIVVGTDIANRNRREIEPLIGFFVNQLVLRTKVNAEDSFRELLAQVREVSLEAYEHQDVPFEKLVDELRPERDLTRSPLFQVKLVLQNAPRGELKLPGLRLSWVGGATAMARWDLLLTLSESEQGLIGTWSYSSDLFDESTIARLTTHYARVLESVTEDVERPLAGISMLTVPERRQLLEEWNDTKRVPAEGFIHEWFAEQVERAPEAVAVIIGTERICYRELNNRSNQLAHYLRELGVGPEVIVGICVERSLEMVVGLLGILKAGGAYLPLNPDYPLERIASVLEDAGVAVLLTHDAAAAALPAYWGQTIYLDADWKMIAASSTENPVRAVDEQNPAYVLYTSGSTGQPKGVMVSHAAIANHMQWMLGELGFTTMDRVLQKTPFTFDASVWEFYAPLLCGGTLVMATPGVHRDARGLVTELAQHRITQLQVVPTMLKLLLEEPGFADCRELRRVFCGGEALTAELAERFRDRMGVELCNLYGPTETTVEVSLWSSAAGGEVTLGRPIWNTQMYVLGRALELLPVGVTGELYIGGAGLARGYVGRADLTAERFIPNPYSAVGDERLYRTGDLARYRTNGELEYLGRADEQIKLRGYRIELGEVEAALVGHPEIREAVVVTSEDSAGEKRLVAYVVPRTEQRPENRELREWLKQKLPDYMVPQLFVALEALPLTASGKIDRRALPAAEEQRPEMGQGYVAPRTAMEEMVANIWAEVLGVERVGIHDNFFELGGDSILSILIVSKVNQAGLQVVTKQLFQHQTVAEFVSAASTPSMIPAEQGIITGSLPLTPIQHWFFEQETADQHHFNQSLLLKVPSTLNPANIEQAVKHLLLHHDALRLRAVRGRGEWQLNIVAAEESNIFTRFDLSNVPEDEHHAVIEKQAEQLQASLNLEQGPLVRVALFELGEHRDGRLLVIIHHLAVDGVSWRILIEDLEQAYEQLERGETVRLPRKTTSYKQWAEHLAEHARAEAFKQDAGFWRAQEDIENDVLPVDHEEGENNVASARTVTVSLNEDETRTLLREMPLVYRTQINDVLLTALIRAYGRWSGRWSLLVNLEGHGREDVTGNFDLTRTVGWFTTLYPVRLKVNESVTEEEALIAVNEQLGRIPNRGLSYGLLRYLSEEKELAEHLKWRVRPQVIFNYLGQINQTPGGKSRFMIARESGGPRQSERAKRRHLLEISGLIIEGRLQLSWTYSENVHRQTTVQQLADSYIEVLKNLISRGKPFTADDETSSDLFPAQISQSELEKAFSEIEFEED